MSAVTDRLKTKKGITVVLAVIAGIAFIVFGYEVSPELLGTATDAIGGALGAE